MRIRNSDDQVPPQLGTLATPPSHRPALTTTSTGGITQGASHHMHQPGEVRAGDWQATMPPPGPTKGLHIPIESIGLAAKPDEPGMSSTASAFSQEPPLRLASWMAKILCARMSMACAISFRLMASMA